MVDSVCARFGATPLPCGPGSVVGISENVKSGTTPINGVRIPPEGRTCGWYIWAGEETSEEADFFVPLHVEHLAEWCPRVVPYLNLPVGWRFLLAPNWEDVWFDAEVARRDAAR